MKMRTGEQRADDGVRGGNRPAPVVSLTCARREPRLTMPAPSVRPDTPHRPQVRQRSPDTTPVRPAYDGLCLAWPPRPAELV